MSIIHKFQKIIDWHIEVSEEEVRSLRPQNQSQNIKRIENLLGEKIPPELLEIYNKYDGENDMGLGSFLGHSFMNLDEIIQQIQFSKTFIKPKNPIVEDSVVSNQILQSIIDLYISEIPQRKTFGIFKKSWHKLVFECSPNSGSGPYFYPTQETTSKKRLNLKIPFEKQKEIWELVGKLHEIELDSYNWDNLEISVYGNGQQNIKRTFYDFDNELSLSSFPIDAIKTKYFHIKWLPIIHDGGGNYIGIDFDPAPMGKKEQVIVFGRDEEEMFVLSESWCGFLNLVLAKINDGGEPFKAQKHLHDIFRSDLLN